MKRTTRNGDSILTRFDYVDDLMRVATAPCGVDDLDRSSVQGTEEFTGTRDLNAAIAMARAGWPDGVKAIQQLRARIEKMLGGQMPQPELQLGYQGQALHRGRYLQGNPRCMLKLGMSEDLTREHPQPRVLDLVVNVAASMPITGEPLMMRGAAAIVLSSLLARYRIRTNIDLVAAVNTSMRNPDAPKCEYVLRVKHAAELANGDRLAFWLGHPAAWRRLLYAVMEHEDADTRRRFGIGMDMGGYGLPCSATNRGDLYIDKMLTATDWSPDLAVMWIARQLKAQGINLKKETV